MKWYFRFVEYVVKFRGGGLDVVFGNLVFGFWSTCVRCIDLATARGGYRGFWAY